MANYNNYYPYNPYLQPYQATAQQQQQPQQIHNGGYVSVRSEDEALMYPVAPGNSVTFINELAPYQYKKTMGFSQFDKPIFEKFRVVKEEAQISPVSEDSQKTTNDIAYAEKSEIEEIRGQIEELQEELKVLTDKITIPETKKTTSKAKKEDEE